MKYVIIGVFDAVQECAMPIQCIPDMLDEDIVETHRRAVRAGKIPAEVARSAVLYKYGTFDDKTGDIETLDQPKKLCALAEFIAKTEVKQEVTANGSN